MPNSVCHDRHINLTLMNINNIYIYIYQFILKTDYCSQNHFIIFFYLQIFNFLINL